MTTTNENIDINKVKSEVFSSNAIRLSGTEWLWTLGICLVVLIGLPSLWATRETFEPDSEYRMPHRLGYDYSHFRRYSHWAADHYDTLMIGDSVLWGNYVSPDNTLTHYLNERAGRQQFANLSISGIHPAALAGLLRYYGTEITGKKVIVNFNPTWLSSPGADLRDEKEARINHPKLIPQWTPSIPGYKEKTAARIDIILQHYIRFRQWTNHLQICYFSDDSISSLSQWTLEHPYQNPFTLKLPVPANKPHSTKIRWDPNTRNQFEFPWVDLETSLQWQFFRKAVEILQAGGNQVFVLVGPFNEHMLTAENKKKYRKIQDGIESWLRKNEIPYFMPTALPSEYYADASHPLAKGYAVLAEQLYNTPSFQTVILNMDSKESDKE